MEKRTGVGFGFGLMAVAVYVVSRAVAPVVLLLLTAGWMAEPLTRLLAGDVGWMDAAAIALLAIGICHEGGDVKISNNEDAIGMTIGAPLGRAAGVAIVTVLIWLLTH